MDFFFFQIPAKLVFLLVVYLSCSLTISFFVVTQDLLSKIYSMLFPLQQEELLNYEEEQFSNFTMFHSALHNDCRTLYSHLSSSTLTYSTSDCQKGFFVLLSGVVAAVTADLTSTTVFCQACFEYSDKNK